MNSALYHLSWLTEKSVNWEFFFEIDIFAESAFTTHEDLALQHLKLLHL